MDPATLVMIYTFLATGEKGAYVKEYKSVQECERDLDRWRDVAANDDKTRLVRISCNKWLKIALAD